VITVDVSKLQEIIAGTVAATVTAMATELRKPPLPTQQEIANLEQAQAERKATAEGVKEKKANERLVQERICTHEHQKSAGGGTHCVWVRDNDIPQSPGYVLCQKCQGRFRPDEPLMRRLDPQAIFDTAKFNLLMADCVTTGAEMFA
jgi:hypothetical protein